jgi:hypothetical protein
MANDMRYPDSIPRFYVKLVERNEEGYLWIEYRTQDSEKDRYVGAWGFREDAQDQVDYYNRVYTFTADDDVPF